MSEGLRHRRGVQGPAEIERLSPGTASNESVTTPTTPPTEGKKSDFLPRLIGTFLMGDSFLALIYMGAAYNLFVVLGCQLMMFHEVLRINQKVRKDKQMPYFKYLPWYFLTMTLVTVTAHTMRTPLLATFPWLASLYNSFGAIAFGLFISGFVGFVLSLRKGLYRYQFGQFTWMTMTLIFIVVQGALLIPNMLRGMIWFLLPISCVVMNDTWAYTCGKCFGKTKLLKLSPKKTLEGFVGAWIFTTIWAFWFAGFLSKFDLLICPKLDFINPVACTRKGIFEFVDTPLPAWAAAATFGTVQSIEVAPVQYHSIVFAAFASLIAPFGGFFASGLKRAFKLKDFGALIPGHGGMTDRMDCQIIMGTFTYVYLETYLYGDPILRCTAESLKQCFLSLPVAEQRQLAADLFAHVPQA